MDPQVLTQPDHDTLIEVKGIVTRMANDLQHHIGSVEKQNADYNTRLTAIELWRHDFKLTWKIVLGAAGFVGAASALITEWLAAMLSTVKHQ